MRILKTITNATYLLPQPRSGEDKIAILAFHRICPLRYKKEFPYANVFPEEFDKQMRFLHENFTAIPVSEYIQRVIDGQINGKEVCVTFDDGFKDNYLYAFPILKKYSIRATFFLTTNYIGSDMIFPWLSLDDGARMDAEKNPERWLPLSWDEVNEMIDAGMEFGTHTHTHRDSLAKMTLEDVAREIEISSRVFYQKTGNHPELFSYPHGTTQDYNAGHVEILKAYNYKAALTTNIGRNSLSQNLYFIKRLVIYENDSLWEVKKKVSGAYDFAETLQDLWLSIMGSRPYKY